MLLLVLCIIYSVSCENICEIPRTVADWIEAGNSTQCNIIKGNFILDAKAAPYARWLLHMFSELTRIEGCLSIINFWGIDNLFFLSKLREIVCSPEQAKKAGIQNVIEIRDNYLLWMGLNSLENVSGPGEIVVSFGEIYVHETYFDKCFTKKYIPNRPQCPKIEQSSTFVQEIYFYATHSQFSYYLLRSCDRGDQCMDKQLAVGTQYYLYPANCTVINGLLAIEGPISNTSRNIENLKTIEVIIGKLEVIGTLFEDFNVLPNLKIILDETGQNMKFAGNTYMKKFRFPSLLPTRALEITVGATIDLPQQLLTNECSHLPQFEANHGHCEVKLFESEQKSLYLSEDSALLISYRISYISSAIGFIFSTRCVILLLFGSSYPFLLSSRILFSLTIIVASLVAFESCLVFQDFRPMKRTIGSVVYVLPIVTSSALINPFMFWLSKVCVAAKNAFLLAIPSLYTEKLALNLIQQIYGYKVLRRKLSLIINFFYIFLLLSVTLWLFFDLVVTVRGGLQNNGEAVTLEPSAIYLPVVMHQDGLPNVHQIETGQMFVGVIDFHIWYSDILGGCFDKFCYWSDLALIVTAVPYHVLVFFPTVGPESHYAFVYFLMYLLLSANRIRWHVIWELFREDYCKNLDFPSPVKPPCEMFLGGYEPNLIYLLLAKIPYIAYAVVSFFCWIFAVHYHWRGASLQLKEQQEIDNAKKNYDKQFSSVDSKGSNIPSEPHICVLPKYDPWSPDIMRYVNLRNGDNSKCYTAYKFLTKLENGKIVSDSGKYDCQGRCITRKDDFKNIVGEWKESDHIFDCDIVEAQCMEKNTTTVIYGMLHTQIVPVRGKETSKPDNETSIDQKRYSVFVILIDSMGASQAERNIPKTMHYLEKSMKAITFPYVNKVGLNSRPNGIALWFGKQVATIRREIYGLPTIYQDITSKEYCNNYIDKFTSIFEEYRNEGYKTLLGEDWARGVLNWPNCKGFKNQHVDHILQPFLIAVEKKGTPLYKTYTKANCKFVHLELLHYLQQFIDAYKGSSMFVWLWTSLVSHEDENGSMRLDSDILDFLVKNREQFDNSFVMIMGDHGLRFGGVTKTKLGALDVNNPMLTVSLPKELRDSEIYKMMERNSKHLQTHFDTRATLLDIAKYQPEANFNDTKSMQFENEKGQSFMREQPGERSCRTLPIPFDYCICEMAKEHMNSTSPESIAIGRALVDNINEYIKYNNATDMCPLWTFSKVVSISAYLPREQMNAYSVVVGVSAPYPKAQFRAVVHKPPTGTFTVGAVDRVDSYGKRGHCANGNLAPSCDCNAK